MIINGHLAHMIGMDLYGEVTRGALSYHDAGREFVRRYFLTVEATREHVDAIRSEGEFMREFGRGMGEELVRAFGPGEPHRS